MSLCKILLSKGSCDKKNCADSHDVQICQLCGVMCGSLKMFRTHLAGRKHKNKVSGVGGLVHCHVCDINFDKSSWKSHIQGKYHKSHSKAEHVNPGDVLPEEPSNLEPGQIYCSFCQVLVHRDNWERHTTTSFVHQRHEKVAAFKAALDEAEKDKNGIVVDASIHFNFGVVEPGKTQTVSRTATVKTTVPKSNFKLVDIKFLSATARGKAKRASPFIIAIQSIKSISFEHPAHFTVTLQQKDIGRCDDRIEIVLEDTKLNKRFVILRTLYAIIGSSKDHADLRPKTPYVNPRLLANRQPVDTVVEGELPPVLKAVPYVTKLPLFKIPRPLLDILATENSDKDTLDQVQRQFMPKDFNSETYAEHFKTLLWAEEFKMERDLEIYDIPSATLRKNANNTFFLEVPGLAEKRPSVLRGDKILVQPHGAVKGLWYEGGVHEVRQKEVALRFHPSLTKGWSTTRQYTVRFRLGRIPMRRQHQALGTDFSQKRMFFPLHGDLRQRLAIKNIAIFNPLIVSNPRQIEAISSVLGQAPGSPPFVIFGPPGTGKTVTVIEAILQLLRRENYNARILAFAPSNSAADLIATRLADANISTDELFRFYAPSRRKEVVSDRLREYTYHNDEIQSFSVPALARLKSFRIIVTTCVSASVMMGVGIQRGHYSHIFIDEAGQATEPEAIISIKTMCDQKTNVILSGDPKQLGPIIHSNIARNLGLQTSYLERLMQNDLYDPHRGHGISVVKLTKNFRSHNSILKFPSDKFYDGELEQCGDSAVINSFIGSSMLPSANFPIIFHAISGKDDREAISPSFFNIDEITQVKEYVQRLKSDRQNPITDADIGIIAPYHAQCLKIRASLRGNSDEVKVGSVEEFQGQERKVIIISTVRSSQDYVQFDLRRTLGFVANPRRFNVAVTRAKALLIIVGDPTVLSLDPLWRSFLNYVYLNGGWTGHPEPSWDPQVEVDENGRFARGVRDAAQDDMNEFMQRMDELNLVDNGNAGEADV